MPSATQGWNRGEIVDKVLDTLGRTGDIELETRLLEDINFAQLHFHKMLDWKYLRKNGVQDGLSLTLVAGQGVYTLNTAEIGFEMRVTDVDKIYSVNPQYASVLTRVDQREIRLTDPQLQQTSFPDCYAAVDHNRIQVWPIPSTSVNGQILYIDGKVQPAFMTLDADYPDIPIEYQEAFLQYLTILGYKRENDPRWKDLMAEFEKQLREDKQNDLREVESNLRMKWPEEELNGGRNSDAAATAWHRMWNNN